MRYPKAQWLGNGVSGGSYTSGPFKVVLHTTETRSVPGYKSGESAPHLTFGPASLKWWQHTDFSTAARALRNGPNPVQTNRDSALQVEIICYSDKSVADQYGGLWVGNLSDAAYAELRAFLAWCHDTFGVKHLKWPGRQALSYSQANAPGFRMTTAQWDAFDGVCAHQHVPDQNTHWDTGALNWSRLMTPSMEDDLSIKNTLIDMAFAAGWAEPDTQAARNYWYGVDPDSAAWNDMRNAIIRGAAKLRNQSGTVDSVAREQAALANSKLSRVKAVL